MDEYKTENGTVLYYKTSYDLGGYNFFTSATRPRGYYISIQRKRNEFEAFSDLSNPAGATRAILFECSRRSAKYDKRAQDMALDKVKNIVRTYAERGVEL